MEVYKASLRPIGSVIDAIDNAGLGCSITNEKKKRRIVDALTILETYSGIGT